MEGKGMRLALLGYYHETNTFAVKPTDDAAFEFLRGDEIAREHEHATSSLAGFLSLGRETGVEIVPLMFAIAGPSGRSPPTPSSGLPRTAGAAARSAALGRRPARPARRGGRRGVPDADGEIAARVRALVGPDIPIGMALDMHANLSRALIDNTTPPSSTAPTRTSTRGRARASAPRSSCAPCAARSARCRRSRRRRWSSTSSNSSPARSRCVADARGRGRCWRGRACSRPRVRCRAIPYADVAEMGMAFLAVADGDAALAREAARWLARRAWDRRAAFVGDTPSPEEALRARRCRAARARSC